MSPSKPTRRAPLVLLALLGLVLTLALLGILREDSHALDPTPTAGPVASLLVDATEPAAEREALDPPAMAPAPTDRPGQAASAALQVLDYLTLRPVPEHRMLLVRDGGAPVEVISSSSGVVPLEPGAWWVREHAAPYASSHGHLPIELAEGELVTLWVQERRDLRFLIVDPQGRPVPDVRVLWHARRGALNGGNDGRASLRTESDAQGRAQLEVGLAVGRASFLAEGFQHEQRDFSGGRSDELRVVLHPESTPGAVLVVHALSDGRAIEGALLQRFGSTRLESIPGPVEGEYELLESMRTNDHVLVRAQGFHPSLVRWGDDTRREVRLTPAGTLRVHVEHSHVDGATSRDPDAPAWLTFAIAPEPDTRSAAEAEPDTHSERGELLAPGARPVAPTGPTSVSLPLGRGITVQGSWPDGCVAWGKTLLDTAETELRLRAAPTSSCLTLTVGAAEDGHDLPEARARARYLEPHEGRHVRRFHAGPDGRIRIPHLRDLVRVDLEHPGREPLILDQRRPLPVNAQPDAQLTVLMRELHDVEVRLQSPEGDPIAGVPVSFAYGRGAQPEFLLTGGLDGEHERWIVSVSPLAVPVSGSHGSARVQLAEGRYLLYASLDPRMGLPDFGVSLYGTRSFELDVPLAEPSVLTLPRPRRVALEIFDGTDGQPVRWFTVGSDRFTSPEIQGNHWEGWVSEQAVAVHVNVPDVGSARVPLEGTPGGTVTRVVLNQDAAATVRVENAQALGSEALRLVVTRRDVEGTRYGHSQQRLKLDGQGRATFHVADSGLDLWIAIESTHGPSGPRLRFEPKTQPWRPGTEHVFRCVATE